jgi:cobalt-zinc-cadmium efflux system protein
MVAVAVAGIFVNLLATRELAKANRSSMNIEGSYQHLLTDLYAFGATALAGVIVIATGFNRADAIAALLVAALMLRAAVGLLRASGRVLLEMAPPDLDVGEIGLAMARHPHVTEVHDLHVWEIGSSFPALSAHILVEADADCHAARRELEQVLRERFGLDHTTLQVDHAHDRLLKIGAEARAEH